MFETQSAGIDAVLKRPDQVLVFISYSHDDKDLADSLRDELRDINSERVLVYQDAYSIGSGERWDLSIIANLKAADWLIFLYTGRERRSYDYCGFEIGIFASAHQLDTSHKISEVARLVCLHDTPCVRQVAAYIGSGPWGRWTRGHGSIRSTLQRAGSRTVVAAGEFAGGSGFTDSWDQRRDAGALAG